MRAFACMALTLAAAALASGPPLRPLTEDQSSLLKRHGTEISAAVTKYRSAKADVAREVAKLRAAHLEYHAFGGDRGPFKPFEAAFDAEETARQAVSAAMRSVCGSVGVMEEPQYDLRLEAEIKTHNCLSVLYQQYQYP